MPGLRVLRDIEIGQHCPCCHHGSLQMVDAEAFEVFHFKVFQQPFAGTDVRKGPVFKLKGEVFCTEMLLKLPTVAILVKHLLRRKIGQELIDIFGRAFTHKKLTGGNVEESHSAGPATEMNGGEKIVFLAVEHIVCQGDARSDEFGYAAFDQLFCQFRVFELVANRHTVTGPYEPRQVGIERMMWKTGHFDNGCVSFVVTAGCPAPAKPSRHPRNRSHRSRRNGKAVSRRDVAPSSRDTASSLGSGGLSPSCVSFLLLACKVTIFSLDGLLRKAHFLTHFPKYDARTDGHVERMLRSVLRDFDARRTAVDDFLSYPFDLIAQHDGIMAARCNASRSSRRLPSTCSAAKTS